MNILLICSAGMSTSLLVTKMEKAAEARGLEITIYAHAASEAKRMLDKADIVLLGPQVRFMKNEMDKLAKVPVQIIDMRAYGTMNGDKVIDDVLKELKME